MQNARVNSLRSHGETNMKSKLTNNIKISLDFGECCKFNEGSSLTKPNTIKKHKILIL